MVAVVLVWLVLVLTCILVKTHISPSDQKILSDWAKENGYELLEAERPRVWCGRFTLLRTTAQRVYRVRLRDRHGRIWGGYLRVGGVFGGGTYVSEDLHDQDDER
jgi:hypothetical protein